MMDTKMYKFYDTCSLLMSVDTLFQQEDDFTPVISSITLKELENIKTSSNKDPDIKYSARKALHKLDNNPNKYITHLYKNSYLSYIEYYDLPITDDSKILATAADFKNNYPETIFITNDLALKAIASLFFDNNHLESINEDDLDDYNGYLELTMSDTDMAEFYSNPHNNIYNLLPNEYLIIKNTENQIVDLRVWTGSEYRYLSTKPINSKWFGKIAPLEGDIYQKMLFDSLRNNKITMVHGRAGSGKSYISLGFLMEQLESHQIDKILIFCNTVATADSAKLGYYPGTRLEKLLDSQIGNFLVGKFGGIDGVQQLINDNKLELLPLSDIRGFDTGTLRTGVYITEAQNLNKSLMKLALQRIGENSICIIDGDNKQQVDLKAYEGANNGMRALSHAFRGEDIYGEVELQIVHRSKIAQLAERII